MKGKSLLKDDYSTSKKCVFKIRKGYVILDTSSILAIQSFGAYSKIISTNKEQVHVINASLKACLEKLQSPEFIRIYESHIINANSILKYENEGGEGLVTLENGVVYKVSQARKKDLLAFIEAI